MALREVNVRYVSIPIGMRLALGASAAILVRVVSWHENELLDENFFSSMESGAQSNFRRLRGLNPPNES